MKNRKYTVKVDFIIHIGIVERYLFRHSEIQNDFDVDGLSFNGYGHAYVRDLGQELSPQIKFSMTPQEHDGLILTAFGVS